MNEESHEDLLENARSFGIKLDELPALLDDRGVTRYIAPVSRSTLYAAASAGEIETVSLGGPYKRGRRLYTTISLVNWLARRRATTIQPKVAVRKSDDDFDD